MAHGWTNIGHTRDCAASRLVVGTRSFGNANRGKQAFERGTTSITAAMEAHLQSKM